MERVLLLQEDHLDSAKFSNVSKQASSSEGRFGCDYILRDEAVAYFYHLPLHLASSVTFRWRTTTCLPTLFHFILRTEDIDDVAIHFRCGDILGGALRDDFGVIKFDNYKRLIFPEARTIGISTQPFELERLRIRDRETAANCKRVVYTLVQYLSDLFPNSTVTVKNSIKDTLPLT